MFFVSPLNKDVMNIDKLKKKPVGQMTGEEFIFLQQNTREKAGEPLPANRPDKRYVYGIDGIARLFGCSRPTAARIKKSGRIAKAITQMGRKIVVDAELALELAGKKRGRTES